MWLFHRDKKALFKDEINLKSLLEMEGSFIVCFFEIEHHKNIDLNNWNLVVYDSFGGVEFILILQ